MAYLKKSDVVEMYKNDILPSIPSTDRPAQREAWNNFVDMLQKDGQISEANANTWDQPAFLKKELHERPKKSKVHPKTMLFLECLGCLDPCLTGRVLVGIEAQANRLAVKYSNGDMQEQQYDKEQEILMGRILQHVPNFPKVGFFMNGDPRGYALKFNPERTPENSPARTLPTDWGGYFILCYEPSNR